MKKVKNHYSEMAKKSKLIKKIKQALKKGDFYTAGKIYEELGDYEKAVSVYTSGEQYYQLGELYERLNKDCMAIEAYKKIGNIDKLSKLYAKRKNIEAACVLLEDNNRFEEAAELYYNHSRYEDAAQIYARKGFYRKAALIYEKEGNLKLAAENFEKNLDISMRSHNFNGFDNDLDKAVELYIKMDQFQRANELLIKFNKIERAAELAFKMGEYEESAKLFENSNMLFKAAQVYEKIGKHKIAYRLMGEDALSKGKKLEAAEWFLKEEDYVRAAEFFEWEKQYEKAAYCYYMNHSYLGSAENYFKAGNEEEAAKMFELGHELKKAAEISMKYKNYQKAGELFEEAGDYFNAGICFSKVNDDKRAIANLQVVKSSSPEYTKAITQIGNIFLKNRKPQLVIEKIGILLNNQLVNKSNIDLYYVYGQALENAGNFKQAFEIYQRILAEDYYYKDVDQRIREVEELIKKYKEMDLVSKDSAGRYRIIEKVGEGGMGVVYKAEDTKLKRTVALKILNSNLIKDRRTLELYIDEARSTASLSHPNIVKVYDIGRINEDNFISMEFVEGENFMDILQRRKVFTIPQILFVLINLLRAVDYSHKKGIINRDIKPQNIMITRQREIKILDFGISIIRGESKKGESGVLIGTPYYMSPEQIQGLRIDHRTDIYSIGVTLFHLITGRVPFKGKNILSQHLSAPVPSIRKIRSDVPNKLIELVEKCMAKKRENRFQSANEILINIKFIRADNDVESNKKLPKEVKLIGIDGVGTDGLTTVSKGFTTDFRGSTTVGRGLTTDFRGANTESRGLKTEDGNLSIESGEIDPDLDIPNPFVDDDAFCLSPSM
jgi:serine/threonine protein kinase